MAGLGIFLLTLSYTLPYVLAGTGTTNVTCTPDTAWMNNALGQSPCLVTAKLVAASACTNSNYNLVPLVGSAGFYGNTDAPGDCLCNDPIYSLYSACATCQGPNTTYLTWGSWTKNCNKTFTTYQGNIPQDTEIPPWAFLNVESKGNFDIAAASSAALAASTSSSTITSTSTSTATITSNPGQSAAPGTAARDSSEPTGTSSVGASSSSSNSSSSNAGPIAGGVIGGLALLGILAGVAFWLRRRQQQKQQPSMVPTTYAPTYPPSSTGSPPPGGPTGMSEYGANSASFASPIAGSNASTGYGAAPMRLYNPADPSTFPDAPMSVAERLEPARPSMDYVNQPAGTSSNPFQTPVHVVHSAYPASVGASSSGGAGYKGVPEV